MLCLHVFSAVWATTTGRLLGSTVCLLHKDGGIAQGHIKQAYGTGSNDQIMIVFANVRTSI